MALGHLIQILLFLHWTKLQGKNGHLWSVLGVDGEEKGLWAQGCQEVASQAKATCTYSPIQLLNIFCVPHNHIVVYHFGTEYSEVFLRTTVLTKRDR